MPEDGNVHASTDGELERTRAGLAVGPGCEHLVDDVAALREGRELCVPVAVRPALGAHRPATRNGSRASLGEEERASTHTA